MKTILLNLMVFFSVFSFAQPGLKMTPDWTASYGNHDHTSRDELSFFCQDGEGNLILAGYTERDSSFGDVLVQKLDSTGRSLWQYRFSSGLDIDYDVPISLFIGKEKDIYVIGQTPTREQFQGIIFLFKLNAQGKLLWYKNFRDIIPGVQEYSFFHAFMASGDTIHLTFSAQPTNSRRAYFFSFSPNGEIVNSFSKDEIKKEAEDTFFPLHIGHDAVGNFNFLIGKNYFGNPSFSWIKRISPSEDTIIPLKEPTNSLIWAGTWDIIQSDQTGNFFIVINKPFEKVNPFYFFKVSPEGIVEFEFESPDSLELGVEDFIQKNDGSFLLTGRYRNSGKSVQWGTFLLSLSEQGKPLYWKFLPVGTVPQKIFFIDQKLVVLLDGLTSGRTSLVQLNDNLEPVLTWHLKVPANFLFSQANLQSLPEKNIWVIAGTAFGKKFEQSVFFSELDFYLEAFSPLKGESKWNYIYSDTGTSHVQFHRICIDNAGNLIALVKEDGGPESPLASVSTRPPFYFDILKYNPTGDFLWRTRVMHPGYEFKEVLKSDGLGNIYYFSRTTDKGFLEKISPAGKSLVKVELPFYLDYWYIDKNNHLFISWPRNGYEPNHQLVELDENLQIKNIQDIPGRVLRLFELKEEGPLYAYTYLFTGSGWTSSEANIFLLKDKKVVWEKTIDTGSPSDGFYQYDVNVHNGNLCFLTGWSGNNRRLQYLTIKSEHYVKAMDNDDVTMIEAHSMVNSNVFLQWKNRLELYDSTLNLLAVFTDLEYSNLLTQGHFLFKLDVGQIQLIDQNGKRLGTLEGEGLNPDFEGVLITPDFKLYAALNKGNSFPPVTSYNHGWKWSRKYFYQYDLNTYMDFSTSRKTVSLSGTPAFNLFPNPGRHAFYLSWKDKNLTRADVKILLFDIQGRLKWQGVWPAIQETLTIPARQLEKGLYFIKFQTAAKKESFVVQVVKE